MQETVAAVLVAMTGWDGERPFVDPMCGSGTLMCEALMRYCRVPAAFLRAKQGVRYMPDYDASLWDAMKRQADAAIRELPDGLIHGSDASRDAVEAARTNLAKLPHGRRVVVDARRFEQIEGIHGEAIVTNPPYGVRVGKRDAMPEFVRGVGDFLKHRCTGSTAFVYFGERELIKSIGLRPSFKKPLANGGLDGRLVKLDLFEGKSEKSN